MRQILLQIGKKFYGDFSDVATDLWRGLFEPMQCHERYQRFKSGRTSFEDDPKSGRPSTSMDDNHVEKVFAAISQNRSPTVREVAEEVGICKSSCHLILTEKLQMRRVSGGLCAASADASLLIHEFLTKHETTVTPPSRPALQIWPPADFSLFPKWKFSLKGQRFQTVEKLEKNLIRDLPAVPQNMFQDAFQKWKRHWEWCIKGGGVL